MKKIYKIVGRTNGWIAKHDTMFNGKTQITIASRLTLKEAKRMMRDFFNEQYETYYSNWCLCCMNGDAGVDSEGLYHYSYDGRNYSIEPQNYIEKYGEIYAVEED